jgi:glutamate N-acetyltransferase/amino-acid N-acetyltransferase
MSVTAAQGFRAAGVAAGIKASGAPDVAVVVNDGPSEVAAAVFTSNRVQAAPVRWSREVLSDQRVRAVVINSGGANACTGPDGFADTHRTAEHAAAALGVGAGDVVVCSTGLIGDRLPLPAVLSGVTAALGVLSVDGGSDAAEAIRTTDSVRKLAVVSHADGWTVGGMAKGAGMLAPGLATMICVLTTDAVLDAFTTDQSLRAAVRTTFDRVDADGCMSTNDTVLLMASGASGVTPAPADFSAVLQAICADLAGQLINDAEGATKVVEIEIVGAAGEDDAVEVGRSIARNNLLKCALYGNDPNWGRVLAAIGTTAARFEPDELDVAINGVAVCRAGAPGDDRALVDLTPRAVHIRVDLHAGADTATIWTNDLSHDYVEENSAYSS